MRKETGNVFCRKITTCFPLHSHFVIFISFRRIFRFQPCCFDKHKFDILVTFNVEVVLFICYTKIVRCYTFDLGKEHQNEKSCKQIPAGLYHKFSPTIRLCVY